MRIIIAIVGLIILLMGTVFALQGAYVLEATFMRGPTWIAVGGAVAAAGAAIALLGFRRSGSSGTP